MEAYTRNQYPFTQSRHIPNFRQSKGKQTVPEFCAQTQRLRVNTHRNALYWNDDAFRLAKQMIDVKQWYQLNPV